MDPKFESLFELLLFFLLFAFNLNLFKSVQYEKLFKKGKVKEIQLIYIIIVIIITYLLTQALMSLFELMFLLG
jgi:uncharacterized membrane protein YwzB